MGNHRRKGPFQEDTHPEELLIKHTRHIEGANGVDVNHSPKGIERQGAGRAQEVSSCTWRREGGKLVGVALRRQEAGGCGPEKTESWWESPVKSTNRSLMLYGQSGRGDLQRGLRWTRQGTEHLRKFLGNRHRIEE